MILWKNGSVLNVGLSSNTKRFQISRYAPTVWSDDMPIDEDDDENERFYWTFGFLGMVCTLLSTIMILTADEFSLFFGLMMSHVAGAAWLAHIIQSLAVSEDD